MNMGHVITKIFIRLSRLPFFFIRKMLTLSKIFVEYPNRQNKKKITVFSRAGTGRKKVRAPPCGFDIFRSRKISGRIPLMKLWGIGFFLCFYFFFAARPFVFAGDTLYFPADGLYSCELYRKTAFTQLEKQYRDRGMEGSTVIEETHTGLAVRIEGRCFTDPVLPYVIKISDDNTVISGDNSTLKGFADKEGTVVWTCLRDHFGSVVRVETKMILKPVTAAGRAASEWNGRYSLCEETLGRETDAFIADGLFYYAPVEKAPYDFLTSQACLLVTEKGSFYSETEVMSRSEVSYKNGDGETESMIYSSFSYVVQAGDVNAEGLVFTYDSFVSSASRLSFEEEKHVFAGVKTADVLINRE